MGKAKVITKAIKKLAGKKDKKITVYYIQPKINNLTGNKKLLEKATTPAFEAA